MSSAIAQVSGAPHGGRHGRKSTSVRPIASSRAALPVAANAHRIRNRGAAASELWYVLRCLLICDAGQIVSQAAARTAAARTAAAASGCSAASRRRAC